MEGIKGDVMYGEYIRVLADMETRALYGALDAGELNDTIEEMAHDEELTDAQYEELYRRAIALVNSVA